MSIALENLRRDLRTRLDSDKHMSGAWAIVPLVPLIIGILIAIAIIVVAISTLPTPGTGTSTFVAFTFLGFLSLLYIGYGVFIILTAFMIFFLVRRRNSHFNRQILLYEDLVSASRDLATKKGVEVSALINNMDRSCREARLDELEKNATLWALFPYFGLIYSSYFLMKDFYKHERREDLFIQDLLRTLYQLGIPVNLPYRTSPVPDRSFALYFILTLITGGIFGVYWVYVLVSDPNNHFIAQMRIEDTIMAQISSALSPSSSPPPSAPSSIPPPSPAM